MNFEEAGFKPDNLKVEEAFITVLFSKNRRQQNQSLKKKLK